MGERTETVGAPFPSRNRWYMTRVIRTQPVPYYKPLPYYRVGGKGDHQAYGLDKTDKNMITSVLTSMPARVDPFRIAHNKALRKVDEQLRIHASFFEDYYERKQALELIHSNGKKIFEFLKNWKNPRYWKRLKKSSTPSDLPSAWLQYQFGIKPLIGGIDRAVNLLAGDNFPAVRVHGTGTDSWSDVQRNYARNHFQVDTLFNFDTRVRVKIGCIVTAVNPNLALAGVTGLGEPLSSAWSVIPWGWAIDYFVNVGEMLQTFDNKYPGIITDQWYTSTKMVVDFNGYPDFSRYSFVQIPGLGPPIGTIIKRNYNFRYSGSVYEFKRFLSGTPQYNIEFNVPLLGTNKVANLFSAIALTMKGNSKR